ncbi:MAG: hypothetical protein IJ880_16015 [Bacilli bacterium]|nr:hypothetical protein [Bacilli bacterium]
MTTINPFTDDRDIEPKFKYYRGAIFGPSESEEDIDMHIENTMNSLYEDADQRIKDLVHIIITPKIDSVGDLYSFKIARTIMNENDAIELDVAFRWIAKFSKEHQFGKYGPIFMVKYIEPILDTRDNKVFAIQFRDLAYSDDMWRLIPDEWKVKDGNTFKLFLRDKMDDGFRNLYERLLFLSYIVRGSI